MTEDDNGIGGSGEEDRDRAGVGLAMRGGVLSVKRSKSVSEVSDEVWDHTRCGQIRGRSGR